MDVAIGLLLLVGLVGLVGLVVVLVRLLDRPNDDLDEEEAAGLVAGTWPAARDVVFGEEHGDGER